MVEGYIVWSPNHSPAKDVGEDDDEDGEVCISIALHARRPLSSVPPECDSSSRNDRRKRTEPNPAIFSTT